VVLTALRICRLLFLTFYYLSRQPLHYFYFLEYYERYSILLIYYFLDFKVKKFFEFFNEDLIHFFYASKEEKIETLKKVFIQIPKKKITDKIIAYMSST
jgi:hypothetical protein